LTRLRNVLDTTVHEYIMYKAVTIRGKDSMKASLRLVRPQKVPLVVLYNAQCKNKSISYITSKIKKPSSYQTLVFNPVCLLFPVALIGKAYVKILASLRPDNFCS
jgi:hypothetical protein